MQSEVWVSQWPDASFNQRMTTSYVVKRQSNYDIEEIGEFESFTDASMFVDECEQLGRLRNCIGIIDRRDTGVDDIEVVIDRNMYRRTYL